MLARNDCSESRFMWMRTREEAEGGVSELSCLSRASRKRNANPVHNHERDAGSLRPYTGAVELLSKRSLGLQRFSVIGAGAA